MSENLPNLPFNPKTDAIRTTNRDFASALEAIGISNAYISPEEVDELPEMPALFTQLVEEEKTTLFKSPPLPIEYALHEENGDLAEPIRKFVPNDTSRD